MLSIVFFLLSIIPSVLLCVLLKRRHREDLFYKKTCNITFVVGLLCVLPIVAVSGTLYILNSVLKLTVFKGIPVLVYQAIYNFIVLALAEEVVKYVSFRLIIKKRNAAYSWADIVAVMVILGAAFGLSEDIPYAVGADAITMLVRGFTMGHVSYGFLMGWFYGKSLSSGKKRFKVIAVILPWLLHGVYDFSLSPDLIAWNDNLVIISLLMALIDVALVVLTIIFFVRSRKKERYNTPLTEGFAEPAASTD